MSHHERQAMHAALLALDAMQPHDELVRELVRHGLAGQCVRAIAMLRVCVEQPWGIGERLERRERLRESWDTVDTSCE